MPITQHYMCNLMCCVTQISQGYMHTVRTVAALVLEAYVFVNTLIQSNGEYTKGIQYTYS